MLRSIARRFRPALFVGIALPLAVAAATTVTLPGANSEGVPVPVPQADVAPAAIPAATQTAIFAGGCFWGVEAVFEHVRGVTNVVSGYAGGTGEKPSYEEVSSGTTGYAEAVKITFDPSKVTYAKLLQIFFSVAHDPTQLNYQGPDHGTQYRSAIFTTDKEQQRVVTAYIEQMTSAKTFAKPIVTEVKPYTNFYAAEEYHQNFAELNPTYPYIVAHDAPKVERLKKEFPALWRDETAKR